ncbi:MAG: hypothetical protein JW725_00515 [Candidatus Babeliaceae bacterium]|nr:hypothetical protein [Candidatus Babeliaceae bacterium]
MSTFFLTFLRFIALNYRKLAYTSQRHNNCVHKTTPALASFGILLSHSGPVLGRGSLPVVRARVRRVTHRVRIYSNKKYELTYAKYSWKMEK